MARRTRASDPTKATRPKPGPVEVRNIAHPKVWQTAIRLAGGDKDKIQIETFSRVAVILD
jgi:hypothetical protein